ncbi:hypothetical protein [Halotalea alkalilenta]|uniref:hypothetical protein n=1 Tax=Halotalea alkalilenta TaxID=376489 RepID=UPI0005B958B7|nr:hypothetical protein [Halotalea alkalilenta]
MRAAILATLLSLGVPLAVQASPPSSAHAPARGAVEVVVPLPPALLAPQPARQYRALPRSTLCRQADGGSRIDTARQGCAEDERAVQGPRFSTSGD